MRRRDTCPATGVSPLLDAGRRSSLIRVHSCHSRANNFLDIRGPSPALTGTGARVPKRQDAASTSADHFGVLPRGLLRRAIDGGAQLLFIDAIDGEHFGL